MKTISSRKEVDWRRRARRVLVEILGGKCSICGYKDTYDGVYDIHHIDPSNKEINFGKLSTLGIKACLIEAKKCVLLCAICHRKIHADLLDINKAIYFYDSEKVDQYLSFGKTVPSSSNNLNKRILNFKKSTCSKCGKGIDKKASLCKQCFSFSQRRVERPSLEVLKNDVIKLGYVGTGKKYGVSDNAIRKWFKNTGLLSPNG